MPFLNPHAIKSRDKQMFLAKGPREPLWLAVRTMLGREARPMLDVALSAFVTLLLAGDAGYGAGLAIIIAVVLSVSLLCMLCFVSAHLVARTLGHTGNAVLSRLLGMLFAAYSVQFVINGIAAVRASLSGGL